MSDCLDSLAIMTVASNVRIPYEADRLWYSRDGGIKRSKSDDSWDPDGITDLSAKEKLRWSKTCEWLDNYFRENLARRKPRQSQPEKGNLQGLLIELGIDVPSALVTNVSNFPWDLSTLITLRPIIVEDFDATNKLRLILLVLSLIYGGIHLATWNFTFASKAEHLLWKTACIDIMTTFPVGILCIPVLDALMDPERLRPNNRKNEIVDLSYSILTGIIFYALSVPYALSRIYIVAESFIGLRHVPIGVYAAVPWVQGIPHV